MGLSGGVDSSVSAYLLKEQGHEVVGVYMNCWDERGDGCVSDKDKNDAIRVCSHLGIKFEYLDFVKQYKNRVIEYFYSEYKAGRTPNPDIMCNKEIKFGLFLNWALKEGFDYVATGHYARVKKSEGFYKLLKGVDETKDQSYFLYILDQKQLSRVIFPVGGMRKLEVRALAEKVGLPTYNKPDSVGICFIGDIDVRKFLEQRLKIQKGNVLNTSGEIVGKHDGIWFYTIGQRHGFEVTKYVGLPLYVVAKNVEKNELVVGFAKDVLKHQFDVTDIHWVGGRLESPFDCEVRVRHLGKLHKALVVSGGDSAKVELPDDPIFGVAPGQSAVFYNGDVVLGGGIIAD